ncbi:hypothetical protein Lfu02_02450 [Longispora fulva]|uniref:Transglutaminase-like putative cysteine protease n=1 Tax=Longispora fulva TaxID=619741 RepID=A0A8J7GQ02_9ACTN|nr:transglutaminase domain-containing protein [Longispora fulva]MBG6135883.1 transglutaminase-like putative cysteine protease [Longispora fulva]GIG55873.1 hypothetical protein Lfu02_02450 [Longispora fulva]
MNRLGMAGLLGATGLAGLLFAPVFGPGPLLPPILVLLAACYACWELVARRPALEPLRPVLLALAGLLAVVETVLFRTTVAGLPTGATGTALWHGVTRSWQLTLQSTWPARPDPELMLFVPLAVLLATVVGVELLRRPLLALLPSLALLGLSQAYQALSGGPAVLAALCYALAAAVLLAARRPGDGRVSWAALTVLTVAAGALAVTAADPADREPYRLRDAHPVPLRPQRITDPLQDIAARLVRPDQEVFRYRADAPVDRWRLAVLDGFDGANWSTDARYYRLGTRLPAAGPTRTAELRLRALPGPWLPSQPGLTAVDGLAPLVDQAGGTLLLESGPVPDASYTLSWSERSVDPGTLLAAAVDPRAPGGLGALGPVPDGIDPIAHDAVLGLRPTFQSALQLERYLKDGYQLAEDVRDLPTGHGWPQLRRFLLESRRGTSEQFAAGYVVLARMSGIPARLAVGFRGSTEYEGGFAVVRNRQVFAWPEVAVTGIGWVPLDPTSGARKAGPTQTDLAGTTEKARRQLPSEQQLRPARLPDTRPGGEDRHHSPTRVAWPAPAAGALAVLLGWLVGVPVAKAARRWRRRRRSGVDGVLGAWLDVRDQVWAHGTGYRVELTPRDLAWLAGEPVREPMLRLAAQVDAAMWSGTAAADPAAAWAEAQAVRRGLRGRPRWRRLRAALEVRTLLGHRLQRAPRIGTGSLV